MLLKFKRPSLPREVSVGYGTIMIGIVCVFTAFMGNMVSSAIALYASSNNAASTYIRNSSGSDSVSSTVLLLCMHACMHTSMHSAIAVAVDRSDELSACSSIYSTR
jgi:hypothetical protein